MIILSTIRFLRSVIITFQPQRIKSYRREERQIQKVTHYLEIFTDFQEKGEYLEKKPRGSNGVATFLLMGAPASLVNGLTEHGASILIRSLRRLLDLTALQTESLLTIGDSRKEEGEVEMIRRRKLRTGTSVVMSKRRGRQKGNNARKRKRRFACELNRRISLGCDE
jgi:hypothetical protein